MTNQITLDVARIAMCAVETVLRKTSPCTADYPQLVEQYIDAVSAYRQAVADTENALKPHTGTAA